MQIKWVAIAVIVLGLLGFLGYRYIEKLKQDKVIAELQLIGQKQLNDSTVARLAVDQNTIAGLNSTVKSLHGKLIAAVTVKVPARDTTIKHDKLPTTMANDTMFASFMDSTFAGIIKGTITVPPWPDSLRIKYTLSRPAFSPTIAFVQVGNRVVAVVSWRGEKVTIESPYALGSKPGLRWFGGFVEGNYSLNKEKIVDPTDRRDRIYGRGGLRITPIRQLDLQAGYDTRKELFVGARLSF